MKYRLKGVHAHSITFRGCSTHSQVFMCTQFDSIAFIGCSHSFKGIIQTLRWSVVIHTHSKTFTCTQLHSGDAHTHAKTFTCTQLVFKGCSIVFNTYSKAVSPQRLKKRKNVKRKNIKYVCKKGKYVLINLEYIIMTKSPD